MRLKYFGMTLTAFAVGMGLLACNDSGTPTDKVKVNYSIDVSDRQLSLAPDSFYVSWKVLSSDGDSVGEGVSGFSGSDIEVESLPDSTLYSISFDVTIDEGQRLELYYQVFVHGKVVGTGGDNYRTNGTSTAEEFSIDEEALAIAQAIHDSLGEISSSSSEGGSSSSEDVCSETPSPEETDSSGIGPGGLLWSQISALNCRADNYFQVTELTSGILQARYFGAQDRYAGNEAVPLLVATLPANGLVGKTGIYIHANIPYGEYISVGIGTRNDALRTSYYYKNLDGEGQFVNYYLRFPISDTVTAPMTEIGGVNPTMLPSDADSIFITYWTNTGDNGFSFTMDSLRFTTAADDHPLINVSLSGGASSSISENSTDSLPFILNVSGVPSTTSEITFQWSQNGGSASQVTHYTMSGSIEFWIADEVKIPAGTSLPYADTLWIHPVDNPTNDGEVTVQVELISDGTDSYVLGENGSQSVTYTILDDEQP